MGLEAHRIEFETINPTNRADILDIFANIGFSVMGENFSDLYLEKAYDWGFIQIAKSNHENMIECLMAAAKEFNNMIPINVINLQ